MPRQRSLSNVFACRFSRRAVLIALASAVPAREVAALGLCSAGADDAVVPCPINLVTEGDSITAGFGSSDVSHRYPDALLRRLQPSYKIGLNDIATPGIAASTIDRLYASRAGAACVPEAFNLLTLLAGTNDGAGSKAIAVYRSLRSIIAKARTGYDRILISTLTSRGNSGPKASFFTTIDNSFDADKLPLNLLIRAGWREDLGADGLLDYAAHPVFATAAGTANTTYYADQLHLTDAGYALMAEIAAPVIQTILLAAGVQLKARSTPR